MCFIKKLIAKKKEKEKALSTECDNLINRINAALQEADAVFLDSSSFINLSVGQDWNKRNASLLKEATTTNIQKYRKTSSFSVLLKKQTDLYTKANSLEIQMRSHNERVAELKIKNAYELIGTVEGRMLDKQQMTCIVKDAHNHLVIAGAGTGKTTTVVGKIKYLLKSQKCKPEDILVLSFTNASASEMSERINKEVGCRIEASTFHKLGLNIITNVNGITPKITQLNLRKFIKDQLYSNMRSNDYLNLLSNYLLYNRVIPKSEFEFKTFDEYTEYLELNPPKTVNNETVKSYGEMDIANFLFQNGIQYIYEHPYIEDTRTSEHGQYKPDFYLPQYDIYIEYFGINEKGEVPPYFTGSSQMTASETYQASMKWKRDIHRTHSTTMIECYAYEKFNDVLLENLEKNLKEKGVVLVPKSTEELWNHISDNKETLLDGITELFETVINLIKSNGYTVEELKQLNRGNCNERSNSLIILLIEPIFYAYCSQLSSNEEIDFNDMINTATKYVEEKKYLCPYKYVIVDEYQDISKARFLLLNSLRNSNDYQLFCVGDDWQSIYRFAGSDIGYILNFERYWGPTEISKIETTYRFSQKLIEISGNFIMQNPAQIKKSIRGRADTNGFVLGEINGYTEKYALEFTAQKLEDLPKNSSVFFIGRYSFDAKLFSDSGLFTYNYNNTTGVVDVKYHKRPDLKMCFITAHKSKGLQADYIFIINNKNSRMGFPAKIQDSAILSLLLDNCDHHPFAEERRLFYVALTRAKTKAFLVTVKNQESEFIRELKYFYSKELNDEQWECPLCKGKLIKKRGPYGEFFGCSNYSRFGCTYKRKIKH